MQVPSGLCYEGNDVGVSDNSTHVGSGWDWSLLSKLAQKVEKILGAFGIVLGISEKILPANRRLQNKLLLDGRLFLS